MSQNLISATLQPADAAEVQQLLATVSAKLSFLSTLQTADMVTLFKAGNTYMPFLEEAYQVVTAHPEIVPAVFNTEEFIRDYTLLKELRPVYNQISELAESIQKTYTAVGSDTLMAALEVYSAVKHNKDKVPGLSVIADDMAVYFKKTKAKVPVTVN